MNTSCKTTALKKKIGKEYSKKAVHKRLADKFTPEQIKEKTTIKNEDLYDQ